MAFVDTDFIYKLNEVARDWVSDILTNPTEWYGVTIDTIDQGIASEVAEKMGYNDTQYEIMSCSTLYENEWRKWKTIFENII